MIESPTADPDACPTEDPTAESLKWVIEAQFDQHDVTASPFQTLWDGEGAEWLATCDDCGLSQPVTIEIPEGVTGSVFEIPERYITPMESKTCSLSPGQIVESDPQSDGDEQDTHSAETVESDEDPLGVVCANEEVPNPTQ